MSAAGQGGVGDQQRSLEMLVPEGGELETRARTAASLARALHGRGADPGDVGAQEVQLTFEREGQTQAGAALEDLLVHHLRAAHRGRSFLFLPAARRQVQPAWEELSSLRDSFQGLPGVPFPGENPLAVAARLLDGLDRLGWDAELVQLWQARLQQLDPVARGGERAFRAALANTPAAGPGSRTYVELLLGLTECLFDRGAVREAREVLQEELRFPSRLTKERWSRLRGWAALLLGTGQSAKNAGVTLELPRALVELREDWPSALPFLAGREVSIPTGGPSLMQWPTGSADAFDRQSVGAVVFAVFSLDADGGVRPLHLEVAPALRRCVDAWVREREDACSSRTTCEHRMVVQADVQRLHGRRLPSCLSPESLALCLTPLLDLDGEVTGWVHLEWEHHLIPEAERLEAVAEVWKPRALRRASAPVHPGASFVDRVSESAPMSWAMPGAAERLDCAQAEPARALSAALFEHCLTGLGIKLSQRRWWAFVVEGEDLLFVTSGGQSLGDAERYPGGARGLDRCRTSSGAVCFVEPEPSLSLHKASASGVVLPLVLHGRLVGMIAIESTRKRDFRSVEVERLMSVVSEFALPLGLAQFRSWHLQRFGNDLYFDGSLSAVRDLARLVNDATRARAVVAISGPGGAGKRMLARWVHWSRGQADAGLCLLHAELDFPQGTTRGEFVQRIQQAAGTVVLDDLQRLAPELQAELLGYLEGGGTSGEGDWPQRLMVMTSRPLRVEAEEGGLLPQLAAHLERLQLFMPPLVERREELPGLVRFLAARFAAEEGSGVARFTDAALGLLWRQTWKANLRELEGFVFKLALVHAGEEVDVDEIRDVARRFKFALLEKLPSRRPRRKDLVQALRTTLNNAGSFNKRRAAMYLGWDPDTLVARLKGQGLDREALEQEPCGWGE